MVKLTINNLKDLKFVINGKEFRDGNKIKIDYRFFNSETSNVEKKRINGKVTFGSYEDDRGDIDDCHLGIFVEIEDIGRCTLPDIFDDIVFEI